MDWKADWIWRPGDRNPINERLRFRRVFDWRGSASGRAQLAITADTRYRLWINGEEAGAGPIRSTPGHRFYDTYDIRPYLRPGGNAIAVEVWHYGHSNYQYIEEEAGLIAQLSLEDGGDETLITDGSWKWRPADEFARHTVKRNVNLGWMEICDAGKADPGWKLPDYDDSHWEQAAGADKGGSGLWPALHPRPIEPLATHVLEPVRVVRVSEIKPIRQVLSVNMRDNFFPGNRDANAKVFSGFLAAVMKTLHPTRGRITFAHSYWNGVQGKFRIGDSWYAAGNELELPPGERLFLMEIGAVHNDVLTHMELDFDGDVLFRHPFEPGSPSSFVTIGPAQTIEPVADGIRPVYGGVEKTTGLDPDLPLLTDIRACSTPEELAAYREQCKDVAPEHVVRDQMIYSLMLRKKTLAEHPVTRGLERLLYGHGSPAELPMPAQGGDIETIVDFGKIYVGDVELDIEAPAGTVVDAYGFEQINPGGAIHYTSGCNNSFRYICGEGRNVYKCGTRMGFRYLIVTVRRPAAPVRLHAVRLHQSSYPVSTLSAFRCSDPLLNDIYDISRHTAHMCMEDTFVDCPTYEQVYWVGDCRVSALVNYRAFGAYDIVRHCLEMVPRAREQSPLLPALLPTDWQAAIPMWTFSWVLASSEYIAYSGDAAFAETIYPEIAATLEAYRSFLNERGLLDTSSWNMLDWAPIDIPYVGVVTAQQALLARCHELAAGMAESLGRAEEANDLKAWRNRLAGALRRELRDPETGEYVDGEHRGGRKSETRSLQTHVLLYLTGCLDETEDAGTIARLLDPPEHWIGIGTPFFCFYLFEAWEKLGRSGRIVDRIRKEWGDMLRKGATTTWESFGATRSYAHAWSAAPAYALPHLLLGVEKAADGFARVRIAPPDTDLEWAEGSVPTPYGRIDSVWTQEAGQRRLTVTVPAGIGVEVRNDEDNAWTIEVIRIGTAPETITS